MEGVKCDPDDGSYWELASMPEIAAWAEWRTIVPQSFCKAFRNVWFDRFKANESEDLQ